MKKTEIYIDGVQNLHIHYIAKDKKRDASDIVPNIEKQKSKWWKRIDKAKVLSIIDLTSKLVSIAAGLIFIVLLILIVFGKKNIGQLQLDTLLTIVSVTFIGGIFSLGGLNLINLQAQVSAGKKILRETITEPFSDKLIGLYNLSKGWHHYFIPSKNVLIIYGHEYETTFYRKDTNGVYEEFWKYKSYDKIEERLFAQTIVCFNDTLVAIGDYSYGTVTLYNLDTNAEKSYTTIPESIYYLEFSPEGKKLLIASKNYKSKSPTKIAIIDIESGYVTILGGSGPIAWINESEFLFVQNNLEIAKHSINEVRTATLVTTKLPIESISVKGNSAVYSAGEYEKGYELSYFDIDEPTPIQLTELQSSVEHIEILENKILFSEGWNSRNKIPYKGSSLKFINLNSDELSAVNNFTGYGHPFYKKYCHLKYQNELLLATRGSNKVIPIYTGYFLKERHIVNFRNHEGLKNLNDKICSIQLDTLDELLYLTALTEKGNLIEIELKKNKR